MKTLEAEFEQMVRVHKGTIYTVCLMFSKDADEVNDLFQEVLINLWRGFGSFKRESKVETWIWRVSFNTCISQERKQKHTSRAFHWKWESTCFTIVTRIRSKSRCYTTVFIN